MSLCVLLNYGRLLYYKRDSVAQIVLNFLSCSPRVQIYASHCKIDGVTTVPAIRLCEIRWLHGNASFIPYWPSRVFLNVARPHYDLAAPGSAPPLVWHKWPKQRAKRNLLILVVHSMGVTTWRWRRIQWNTVDLGGYVPHIGTVQPLPYDITYHGSGSPDSYFRHILVGQRRRKWGRQSWGFSREYFLEYGTTTITIPSPIISIKRAFVQWLMVFVAKSNTSNSMSYYSSQHKTIAMVKSWSQNIHKAANDMICRLGFYSQSS